MLEVPHVIRSCPIAKHATNQERGGLDLSARESNQPESNLATFANRSFEDSTREKGDYFNLNNLQICKFL